jgi:hypothetical protein
MELSPDRREARRFSMTLPMRILPREASGSEFIANTRDVSYRGLYFHADARFSTGGEIEFIITLPQEVTKTGDVNIRCKGLVIRVDKTAAGQGIAARIERYEFVPSRM